MAELASTAQDPSRDFIRATPRNPVFGYLSDLVESSYSPERTQQMQSVAQFFGAPAISQTLNRMAYGEPLTTGAGGIGGTSRLRPEVAEAAMSVTNFLPTSGIAKGAALTVPQVLSMFVGARSLTWNASAAEKAKIMTDIGIDARTIWKETGTWKGPDGKWRQEIDDSGATFSGLPMKPAPVSASLQHDPFSAAYPNEMQMPAMYSSTLAPGVRAQYGTFHGETGILGDSDIDTSTMLHELQHAVQAREGFARGGSPKNMPLILEDLAARKRQEARRLFDLSSRNDPLDPGAIVKPGARAKGLAAERQAADYESMRNQLEVGGQLDAYRRLAGEAEARATQARMNMTPAQRRAAFPEESYDVPINQLIVR
jgi:hypothetical protein